MKVVILAGGLGTRIAEESHLVPKPMLPIGGQPIMWHIMKHYSHFGYNDFVICCGYRGYIIKEYFANYYLHRSDVTFDFSERNRIEIHNNIAEPWRVTLVDTGLHTMTAGRIKRIQPYIGDEPFMLTYGDGVSDVNLNKLLEHHQKGGKAISLTAVQPGGRFGVLNIDEESASGAVYGFQEKAQEDGGWINAGFMVVQPEVFSMVKNDSDVFEAHILPQLSRAGKLDAYKHYGYWQCMDTQRDKQMLESRWAEGSAPWKLWVD